MKATWEKLEKNWFSFSIEVEPDRLDRAVDQAFRKLVQRANIPGFRRGKAPRWIFERHHGKSALLNEAVENLLPEVYSEAVAEAKISPIDQPEVDLDTVEEGKPLLVKGKVQVKPEVTLGRLSGFDIALPEVTVTDEQVDAMLDDLRQRAAVLEPDPEAEVQQGSFAVVDFVGEQDGQPLPGAEAQEFPLEIGSGRMIPGFEEQLLGAKAGETREFQLSFPEDYHVEHLRGKLTSFKVTIRDVKKKVLPELTDAFAAEVSRFQTLQELRGDISNRLGETARAQAERDFRTKAQEAVAAEATVELPETLVHQQIHELIDELSYSLRRQGMDLDQYLAATGKDHSAFHDELRGPAEKRAKMDLVLEAVAIQANLEVSDSEVDAEVDGMTNLFQNQKDHYAKLRQSADYRRRVRGSLLKQKASQYLFELNTPSDTPASAAEEKPQATRKATRATKAKAAEESPAG